MGGFFQHFFQVLPSAADPRLDSPNGPLDDPGDLLLREPLHVLKNDRDPVPGVERVQGFPQVADEPGVRRVFGIYPRAIVVREIVEGDRRHLPPLLDLRLGQVGSDGIDPGGEGRYGFVPVGLEIDPEERLLGEFDGLLVVARELIEIVHDPVLV